MATVGDDPLVRLRDVRTGRLSNELIRPSERGMSLAFSPDGSRIVTVRLSDVSVWHA